MTVTGFQIDDALKLTPFPPERAAEALDRADARLWIDLQLEEPGELEGWLDTLGVTGLSRRLCLGARDRPGFYPLKKEIFLVIPVPAGTEGPIEVVYLAFLCRENLLLTLQDKTALRPRRLTELDESEAWLPDRSIVGLVSAELIALSQGCLRRAAALRRSIFALQERMDREPDTVEAEEILDMRRELLALEAVVSDQLPSVQALSATNRPSIILRDAQEYLNCAVANLQAADGSVRWLELHIGALHSGFQMHQQGKMNRRLGVLTILSAIFMPMTLLAGIWGMNFEVMPELKYPFGYPIALGLMALIGLVMYRFFRRGGWFG